MECTVKLVNWNIGGAKYLETNEPNVRVQLQNGLNYLVAYWKPHVICLQEFTQFAESGLERDSKDVVECPDGYRRYVFRLIDTDRHSHQGKWNNVRERGHWPRQTYFSQGNAIFVRRDVSVFPVWSLPACGVSFHQWKDERMKSTPAAEQAAESSLADYQAVPEDIILQTGFYRGTRDTEPRAATVLHLVIDRPLQLDQEPGASKLIEEPFRRPLDVFIVNTHLTTLTNEREGIPAVDAKASRRRLGQLEILFDDVISEYNLWTKDDFRIRGKHYPPFAVETHDRCAPVWILCGDFNFTRQSAEYRYIKDRNFMDLHFDSSRDHFTKAIGLGQEPRLTLDYVFAGPAFEALDQNRTESKSTHQVLLNPAVKVSDHYPICASLVIDQADDVAVRCKTCREPAETATSTQASGARAAPPSLSRA